jgi:hypothetical protein
VAACNSPVSLDPTRLGSVHKRRQPADLSLVALEPGRVDLSFKGEVLLMQRDFLSAWFVAMMELAHEAGDRDVGADELTTSRSAASFTIAQSRHRVQHGSVPPRGSRLEIRPLELDPDRHLRRG